MLAAGIDLLPESGGSARLGNRDDAEPYLLGHKPRLRSPICAERR